VVVVLDTLVVVVLETVVVVVLVRLVVVVLETVVGTMQQSDDMHVLPGHVVDGSGSRRYIPAVHELCSKFSYPHDPAG